MSADYSRGLFSFDKRNVKNSCGLKRVQVGTSSTLLRTSSTGDRKVADANGKVRGKSYDLIASSNSRRLGRLDVALFVRGVSYSMATLSA